MIVYLIWDFVQNLFFESGLPYLIALVCNWVFYIALIASYLIGRYFMFKKIGLTPWHGLIPVYGLLKLSSKTWSIKYWWIMIGVFTLWFLFDYLSYMVFETFILSVFAYEIFICNAICFLVVLAMWFWLQFFVAKSFNKGLGYALGLFFVSEVFNMIIGLGNAEYVGNDFAQWENKKKEKFRAMNEDAYKKAFEKKAAREAKNDKSKVVNDVKKDVVGVITDPEPKVINDTSKNTVTNTKVVNESADVSKKEDKKSSLTPIQNTEQKKHEESGHNNTTNNENSKKVEKSEKQDETSHVSAADKAGKSLSRLRASKKISK